MGQHVRSRIQGHQRALDDLAGHLGAGMLRSSQITAPL